MEEFAELGSWPGMAAGERADRQMQRPTPKGCRGNYTLIGYLPASCVFFHPATGAMLACVDGDIELNFIDSKELHVQAMALDCRTILGPYVPVASVDTMRRMLAYLGATPEQIEDFSSSYRRWVRFAART